MDFKTKALFLFGILLFGIVLSYFLSETFMEGFASATPTVTSATPTVTSATPAVALASSTPSPGQPKYDNYNHYNDMTSAKYYGSTGTPINPIRENDTVVPHSSLTPGASKNYGTQYYSTLPPGIPASQIIPGDEHLYILKSEIVPPVCPACPAFPSASIVNNQNTPPCPPCGRCPEPSFECKKVPNYNAVNSDSMPVPVLNDFSSFGM